MSRPPRTGLASAVAAIRTQATRFWATRNVRERMLVVAIGHVALIALALGRIHALQAERAAMAELDAAMQARTALLDAAPVVARVIAARAPELESARALDAETMMARLEKLLDAAKLKAESGRPVTREAGAAYAHVVTLRAEGAGLAELIAFRRTLDAAKLPLAMTGLEIEADPSAPEKLRLRIEITALQPRA